MNITQTFRRKNKYHKPIVVFKELYRDYFQHLSPNQHRQSVPSSQSLVVTDKKKCFSKDSDPLKQKTHKTNFSEQLSKYLQKHGDPGTSILRFTAQEESILKRSKSSQNSTYVFKLLQRTQLQELQKEKRSYFSNNYTKSHPFFEKAHEFFKEKTFNDKENHIPKILPQIFKETNQNIKKPLQKRIELQELKNKFVGRKQLAVEKFEKIRHNFLMKNNYKPQAEPQRENRPILSYREMSKRSSFETTKENIFPEV